MRIRQISVTNLFDLFDHTIPVNVLERVTIIHGPNGYGKTVILNMIASLINGDYDIFQRIPFTEFRVDLTDNTSRIIRRRLNQQPEAKNLIELDLIARDANGLETPIPLKQLNVPKAVLDGIDRFVPTPFRRAGSGWVDPSGNTYSLTELLERFPDVRQRLPKRYRSPVSVSLEGLEVLFVETNRLGTKPQTVVTPQAYLTDQRYYLSSDWHLPPPTSERPEPSLKVDQNSRDLVQRIKSALADYAKHSQDRDRTFPERLVRFLRTQAVPLGAGELLAKMTALEAKRKRLSTLGVLDSEVGLHDLSEDDVIRASEALTIYVGDVEEKLGVFDDLIRRIGTLQDVLNGRLPYKQLVIDRDKGMRIFSRGRKEIELADLSSGEQHQLVVLYELLFRSPRHGLVLVDEPEISLHVAWQSDFVKDLIGVLEVTDSYAIIATHSPVVIGDKWDIAIELKGPTPVATLT